MTSALHRAQNETGLVSNDREMKSRLYCLIEALDTALKNTDNVDTNAEMFSLPAQGNGAFPMSQNNDADLSYATRMAQNNTEPVSTNAEMSSQPASGNQASRRTVKRTKRTVKKKKRTVKRTKRTVKKKKRTYKRKKEFIKSVPRTILFYEVSFDLWKEYKTWGAVPTAIQNDAMTKTGKTVQQFRKMFSDLKNGKPKKALVDYNYEQSEHTRLI
jgi:hypothetical protein